MNNHRTLICLAVLWLTAGCELPGPRVGLLLTEEQLNGCPPKEGEELPMDEGDGGVVDGPGFSELMAKVFTPTCATSYCHQKDPPPVAPMSLEPNKAYLSLVNAPSQQAAGKKRVVPGDPANSYLIQKLRGLGTSGSGTPVTRMPLNKPPLDEKTIRSIEAWIKRGAPND